MLALAAMRSCSATLLGSARNPWFATQHCWASYLAQSQLREKLTQGIFQSIRIWLPVNILLVWPVRTN